MRTDDKRDVFANAYLAPFHEALEGIRLLAEAGRALGPRPLSAVGRLQEETVKLMRTLAEMTGSAHLLPPELSPRVRRSPNSQAPSFFNEAARISRVSREKL
ncbi:hypothetical protein [Cohnella sp. REN36]|uniref:hypothetical protein n=1 Tax=Cohnella sp. REN36 TaxID=2887347 RepID=UPI001D133539|nr:hypothetical protein [Cohnella sp. REN36]MCC3374684.1 hypothetical protein [Cohnella sp. REN36]